MSAPASTAVMVVVSQTRYNLLATLRAGSAIALGITMPVVFYLGASALFGSDAMGGDSPVEVRSAGEAPDLRTFYVGGFMAYAAIYSAFVALLPDVVDIRERGLLKRLRGTPLPLSAFVAARFAIAVLITTIGVAVIAALGWAVFDVPHEREHSRVLPSTRSPAPSPSPVSHSPPRRSPAISPGRRGCPTASASCWR